MHYRETDGLVDLHTLIAIADTGSFTAAGRILRRHPTIIARRLQALEEKLGVRLAERTTRHVLLTEAGATYLERIRPLVDEIAAANRDVASYATGEPRGRLRLALPATFGRTWLGGPIVSFLELHPNVSIDVDYSNRFVDVIGERFDLAVRLAELSDSRLIARKVGERRRLVCASPKYLNGHEPIDHPEDLARHSCLVFAGRRDPLRWTFTDRTRSENVSVTVLARIASDEAEILLDAACAGMGVIQTSDWHAGPALASGELVEVLDNWSIPHSGGIYVVTPVAGGMPNKTRAFSDWIAAALSPAPWSC